MNSIFKEKHDEYCERLASIYRELNWSLSDQVMRVLRMIYGAVMIPLVCDLIFTFFHQIAFELAVEGGGQGLGVFEQLKRVYSVVRWPIYYVWICAFWKKTTLMSWNYSFLWDCQEKILTQRDGRCPRCGHYMKKGQYTTKETYFTGEYKKGGYWKSERTTDHRGETTSFPVWHETQDPVYATKDVKHDYVRCTDPNCGFNPEKAYGGSRYAYKFREMPHEIWNTECFIIDRQSEDGYQYGTIFFHDRFIPLYNPVFMVCIALVGIVLVVDQYYIPFSNAADYVGFAVLYCLLIWKQTVQMSAIKKLAKSNLE